MNHSVSSSSVHELNSELYLVQEAGEEGVRHVVVEERPLVHQDALDVLAEGRVFTQQLHARFSQNGLKEQRR